MRSTSLQLLGAFLLVFGAAGLSAQITATLGDTNATSNNFPFNYSSGSGRFQHAYSASELQTATVPSGALLTEIRVYGSTVTPPTYGNFRMRVGHLATGLTPLSITGTFGTNTPSLTTCIGPTSYSPTTLGGASNTRYVFTCTTPFVWNGTDGIVIDWSYDSRIGTGWLISSSSGRNRVYANGGNWQTTSGTASNSGNVGVDLVFVPGGPGIALGDSSPQSGQMTPPETDLVVADINASTFSANHNITGITFTKDGTIADSDITNVKLVEDVNTDGVIDAGDTVLGQGALTSGKITFSGTPLITLSTAAPTRLLLGVSTTGTVAPGTTMGMQILAASDFTHNSPSDFSSYPIGSTGWYVFGPVTSYPYFQGFESAPPYPESTLGTGPGTGFPTNLAGQGGVPGSGSDSQSGPAIAVVPGPVNASMPHTGSGMLRMQGDGVAFFDTHFDLSTVASSAPVKLEFWWADSGAWDNGSFNGVYLSTNGGTTWELILYVFTPSSVPEDQWFFESIDLSPLMTAASLNYSNDTVIRFQMSDSINSELCLLDDISLRVPVPSLIADPSLTTPQTASNGLQDQWLGGVVLNSYQTTQTMQGIVFTNNGTLASSSLTNLKLWADTNSNDTFEATDTQIGSTVPAMVGNIVTFTAASLFGFTSNESRSFFVTADINATSGGSVFLDVVASTDISSTPGPVTGIFPVNGLPVAVLVPATLPYFQGFETAPPYGEIILDKAASGLFPNSTGIGSVPTMVSQSEGGTGLIEVTGGPVNTSTPHTGTGMLHMSFDDTCWMDIYLNMGSLSTATNNIVIDYWWNDEGLDTTYQNACGVFLSLDNGATWALTLDLFPAGGAQAVWNNSTIDLTGLMSAASLNFTNQMVVRFQARDTITSDRALFDDINILESPSFTLSKGTQVIANNGTHNLGTVYPSGTSSQEAFTISNPSGVTLNINSFSVTAGTNVSGVSFSSPATTIAPSGTSNFTVSFTPGQGPFDFVVNATSNDPANSPFQATIAGDGNTPPVITVTTAAGPVINNSSVPVPYNIPISGTGLSIGIDDIDAQATSVQTMITNVTTQGLNIPGEWESAAATPVPFNLTPTTGTLNVPNVSHVVTITAHDGMAPSTFTFTVDVGVNTEPTLELPAGGSAFTGTSVAGYTASVLPGPLPADVTLELTDIDNNDIDVTAIVVAPGVPTGITAPTTSVGNASGTAIQWTGDCAPTIPGIYTWTVTITDNVGAPVNVDVAIEVIDVAPVASIGTSATAGDGSLADPFRATVAIGNQTQLELATVSDANVSVALTQNAVDGDPANASPTYNVVFNGTVSTGTITASPANTRTVADVGDHFFTVTVSDGTNNVDIHVRVTVEVGTQVPPDVTVMSEFTGTVATGFSLIAPVNPAGALNAVLSVTDTNGDDIEVFEVSPLNGDPAGISAPSPAAPATGPVSLAWTGTFNPANAPGDYVYAVEVRDGITTPVVFTVTLTLADLPPTHSAGLAVTQGDGSAGFPYQGKVYESGKANPRAMVNVADPNTGQSLFIDDVVVDPTNPTNGAGFVISLTDGVVYVAPVKALTSNDVGEHNFEVSVSDGTNTTSFFLFVKVVSAESEKANDTSSCSATGGASWAWALALLGAFMLPVTIRRLRSES